MEKRSKRVIKYGLHSFLTAIAVTGIFIILYAFMGRYTQRWDLTENKRFSLSDQTKKVLKDLKKKVEIYAFWQTGTPKYMQVEELLKEYASASPYIKYEMIDPEKNPSRALQMGISEYGTTVFKCGERRKDVYEREVFSYSYFSRSSEFRGEEAFTSAIIEVTSEKKKKIYFLTGHGEKDLYDNGKDGYSNIRDYLEKEGFEVATWNILEKGKLPEDAELLILAGPKYDLLEKEKEVLFKFIEEDKGNLLIMIDPGVKPGIKSLLEKLGIGVKDGMIIDMMAAMLGDAGSPLPEYPHHPITQDLMKQRSSCILCGATALEKKGGIGDIFLQSRASSWLEKDYRSYKVKFDKGRDEKGPLPLGIAMVKDDTRIVVYGDSDFPSNSWISREGTTIQGNLDLFLNTIDWLTEQEKKISIRPRVAQMRPFYPSKKEARFIYITSIFVVPLIIVLTGTFVWWKRRAL